MIIGERLKKMRKDKGLTADEASVQIGINRTQLLNYENEKNDPSTEILLKLMNFYECSADYLLGRTDSQKPVIAHWDIDPLTVLKRFGPVNAAKFLKALGIPVKIHNIDIDELLTTFPPETVGKFLLALDIPFDIRFNDSDTESS